VTQTLRTQLAVAPEQLRRRVDLTQLPLTTADVSPLEGTIGQPRAVDAIGFGLEINSTGYNLYVAGPAGSGRERTVLDYLHRFAPTRPSPSDWIYIYNFDQPDQPSVIRMPRGRGRKFAADMDAFLDAAQRDIPRAFESDDYERHRREALAELSQRRDELLDQLQNFARDNGFAIEMTPMGMVAIPLSHGKPLSDEDYQHLPDSIKQGLERRNKQIQERIADTLRQVRQMQKEGTERVRQLDHNVVLFTVGPHLDELREAYTDQPVILVYLDQIRKDIPEHLDDFRSETSDGQQQNVLARLTGFQREDDLSRYRVNVFVDNDELVGAPIVIERNPTYYNLFGRIDYRATFGSMVTDFRQIKPGALHKANGGFLVLQVLDVLRAPFAWDALKRALISKEVAIENLGDQYTALPTERLRPQAIPLDLKVILLGPPDVYYLLYQLDPDFQQLFKVKADFAPDMDWSDEHVGDYAAFISRLVQEEGIRHFDRTAVAGVIEYGSRLREDQRKLSTRLRDIADLVSEASYWAGKNGHDIVQAADVDQAITTRKYRSNLIQERLQEVIENGTILIDTVGAKTAQVNGVAIIDLGGYAFGEPSRITARVYPGRGSLQSIEREIELSGPIHSKGFMILSGYLAGQYSQRHPLSINATITFEQSYDEVEGDSASSTELYALLSALSGLPLHQGIAVTGSVNQHGEVQAVGGVTFKIEGFFAVCKAKGLTGEQGIIIPASNVPNLMLDEEVIDAVRSGQFHIWSVRSIDEGIELLTGVPAGRRDSEGQYPEGTVHRLVEDRMKEYAERIRAFATDHKTEDKQDKNSTD